MKIKIVLAIALLFFSLKINSQATKFTPTTYIEKYNPIATDLMNEHKIPVSVILGISMLESGYGTSKLSVNKHNYFGIKKGKYYRGYNNDIESFNDFCALVKRKKFYNNLVSNDIKDYNIWLTNLKKIGYSTSSDWQKKVTDYINKYQLYKYDVLCID